MVSDVNITKWELRYAQDNNRYKMKKFWLWRQKRSRNHMRDLREEISCMFIKTQENDMALSKNSNAVLHSISVFVK